MTTNQTGKTKVLIVDDSELARNILRDILQSDSTLHIVGEAGNGREAIELSHHQKPDIIIMDIQMPIMDGFEATEHIMAYNPTPILIFSSAIDKSEAYTSIKAISLGALDIMTKPDFSQMSYTSVAREIIRKVKTLSRIKVIPHIHRKFRHEKNQIHEVKTRQSIGSPEISSIPVPIGALVKDKFSILAVGASTGGPMALEKFLAGFPAHLPVGIAIVLHITRGFIESYTEWLNKRIPLRVKVAEQNEWIQPGTVYFAPDDIQMLISRDLRINLDKNLGPWGVHKPAVNHLFKSVGENLGPKSIAVILTGMGDDGAEGMKVIHDRGGYTISQDKTTSLIFGMPKAAMDNGSVKKTLPLEAIAGEIIDILRQ